MYYAMTKFSFDPEKMCLDHLKQKMRRGITLIKWQMKNIESILKKIAGKRT